MRLATAKETQIMEMKKRTASIAPMNSLASQDCDLEMINVLGMLVGVNLTAEGLNEDESLVLEDSRM